MGIKPTRIKSDAVAVLIDGLRARRVQKTGRNWDVGITQVSQLADPGIVDETPDTPNLTITVEANDWGTNDIISALANHVTDFDDTAADAYNTNIKIINESEFDRIRSDKLGWSPGEPYNAVDIIEPVKEGNSLTRARYYGNCRINKISGTYDVKGIARETYSLETDTYYQILNNLKDYVCFIGIYKTASTFSVVNHRNTVVDGTAYDLDFTKHLIFVNGIDVTTKYSVVISSWTNVGLVTITGLTLNDGDRIRILAKPDTAGTFPAMNDSGFGGCKKGNVVIVLKQDGAAEEQALRIQSVAYDVDLGREVLDELGNEKSYDRSIKTPTPVSATITVIESDLEEWAKMCNKEAEFNAATLTNMKLEDFVDTITLSIKLYKSQSSHVDTGGSQTLVKRIIISSMRPKSGTGDNSVGANGTVSFTLGADNYMNSGTGINPSA